jgi:ribosomal protein S3AE
MAAGRVKKKKWFTLYAPSVLGGIEIGESPAFEQKELLGRFVTLNLMALTRNVRNQDFSIKFEISELKDKDSAGSKIIEFYMNPSSVKRIIRKKRDRIDDSFALTTSDGTKIRIKPVIITATNLSAANQTRIMKAARHFLFNKIKKTSYNDLLNSLVNHTLKKEMASFLNLVAPIERVEIRYFGIENNVRVKELTEAGFSGFEPPKEKPQPKKKPAAKSEPREEQAES